MIMDSSEKRKLDYFIYENQQVKIQCTLPDPDKTGIAVTDFFRAYISYSFKLSDAGLIIKFGLEV